MADQFARRITLLEAITDVMGELGLQVPVAVVGNPELTTNQFFRLANRVGQELTLDPYKWQFLTAEFAITTEIGNAGPYPLPADFNGFVNDAGWNRTTRLPVIGALEQYEWQMLKARLISGSTFTMMYVLNEGGLLFYAAPITVQTIVIAYTSRGWVKNSAGDSFQDVLLADTDVILFEPQLFKAALRLAWYETKQFNTAGVQKNYDRAYAAAKAIDTPGRTLSLGRKLTYPYLGAVNLPDTGYGA